MTIGEALRAARETAGLSLAVMAERTHYSKSMLSLVENGKRAAADDLVAAYERVLGVGGLGDCVNRREFIRVAGIVAGNSVVATELAASIAGNDSTPLLNVQTTHGIDMAIATLADRRTLKNLHEWVEDSSPVLRVNAIGIIAKVPGSENAARVVEVLERDHKVRSLYTTAVVSRVCSVPWSRASLLVEQPRLFPHPALAAQRFARETLLDRDSGARWCSAAMLQALSPLIGR